VPICILDPRVVMTAVSISRYGGQITTSQCEEHPIDAHNLSKKGLVSAGFLYIFQFPALMGFLIFHSCNDRILTSAYFLIKAIQRDAVAATCCNADLTAFTICPEEMPNLSISSLAVPLCAISRTASL
jgi:hypothetical protein